MFINLAWGVARGKRWGLLLYAFSFRLIRRILAFFLDNIACEATFFKWKQKSTGFEWCFMNFLFNIVLNFLFISFSLFFFLTYERWAWTWPSIFSLFHHKFRRILNNIDLSIFIKSHAVIENLCISFKHEFF